VTAPALTTLEAQAAAGETGALLELGSRLLTGEGVPLDADRGAVLVTRACAQGSAEAASLLATLEAVGAGRPQNWDRAFDHLLLACERGLARAQAQLAILSGGSGTDWKAMRASLDVAKLTAAPPKRSLSEDPRIRTVERFASPAECDWAVAAARGRLARAAIVDPLTGAPSPHPDRTNSAMGLSVTEIDLVVQVLRSRIATATNLPLPVFEQAQILHYSAGQEFRAHFDFLDPALEGPARDIARSGQRIATFLVYLNSDFDGGETDFPKAGVRYRGGKGDALFWANVDRANAPDPRTLHAGLPPTRGEKWILSQWIRDRSPGAPPPLR
jgi:hypothetical protein